MVHLPFLIPISSSHGNFLQILLCISYHAIYFFSWGLLQLGRLEKSVLRQTVELLLTLSRLPD